MSKTNKSSLSILLRGIIAENPVLVLVLGTCPTLAQTGSVISAVGMGIAATAVLVCSNVVISLLRRAIPDTVRIPCYIVVIAGFVSVVQMLMNAYLPALYDMLGVYLALIVVNCIILDRAEMFASKNSVGASALDGLGMGIGFLLTLFVMATIREVLGAGTFAGIKIPFLINYNFPILKSPPGGFFVFGCMIAAVNTILKSAANPFGKRPAARGCPSFAACEGEFDESVGKDARGE